MVWAPRVTVAAVIRDGSRFLIVEELADGQQVLNQPAGHLERGESLLDAVRREVLEETTYRFEPTGLVGIYRWVHPHSDSTFLRFCFTGELGHLEPNARRDPDILATHWLDAETIRAAAGRLRSPLVLRCLEDALARTAMPLDMLHDVAS
jgi:8-oxo-dGTP pyrophosphatase MutT (NUDIX family)